MHLFFEEIARQIEAGANLQEVASLETGLPLARLQGETGRVTGQLRLFAELLRRGDFMVLVLMWHYQNVSLCHVLICVNIKLV